MTSVYINAFISIYLSISADEETAACAYNNQLGHSLSSSDETANEEETAEER
jgi:hypothetical protein